MAELLDSDLIAVDTTRPHFSAGDKRLSCQLSFLGQFVTIATGLNDSQRGFLAKQNLWDSWRAGCIVHAQLTVQLRSHHRPL